MISKIKAFIRSLRTWSWYKNQDQREIDIFKNTKGFNCPFNSQMGIIHKVLEVKTHPDFKWRAMKVDGFGNHHVAAQGQMYEVIAEVEYPLEITHFNSDFQSDPISFIRSNPHIETTRKTMGVWMTDDILIENEIT